MSQLLVVRPKWKRVGIQHTSAIQQGRVYHRVQQRHPQQLGQRSLTRSYCQCRRSPFESQFLSWCRKATGGTKPPGRTVIICKPTRLGLIGQSGSSHRSLSHTQHETTRQHASKIVRQKRQETGYRPSHAEACCNLASVEMKDGVIRTTHVPRRPDTIQDHIRGDLSSDIPHEQD